MVIEASLGYMGPGEVLIQVGAAAGSEVAAGEEVRWGAEGNNEGTYLYCLSSSMTWTPWSYCSAGGASPAAAEWPFMIVMVAVGGSARVWSKARQV